MPEATRETVSYGDIATRLAAHRLEIFGAFHPRPEDKAPSGTGTILLVGPGEPGFWAHITTEPEFTDGAPDPMDRWSRRVIGTLACDLRAKALFPFGGPPWQPFIAWAHRSGRAWESPVGFLVHDRAGLMVSYRGALALEEAIDLPAPPAASPCATCAEKPCLTACPVGALAARGYDAASCHGYLDTAPGQECLGAGCQVRRACPVSRTYGRVAEQSAFHMRHFHR